MSYIHIFKYKPIYARYILDTSCITYQDPRAWGCTYLTVHGTSPLAHITSYLRQQSITNLWIPIGILREGNCAPMNVNWGTEGNDGHRNPHVEHGRWVLDPYWDPERGVLLTFGSLLGARKRSVADFWISIGTPYYVVYQIDPYLESDQ